MACVQGQGRLPAHQRSLSLLSMAAGDSVCLFIWVFGACVHKMVHMSLVCACALTHQRSLHASPRLPQRQMTGISPHPRSKQRPGVLRFVQILPLYQGPGLVQRCVSRVELLPAQQELHARAKVAALALKQTPGQVNIPTCNTSNRASDTQH